MTVEDCYTGHTVYESLNSGYEKKSKIKNETPYKTAAQEISKFGTDVGRIDIRIYILNSELDFFFLLKTFISSNKWSTVDSLYNFLQLSCSYLSIIGYRPRLDLVSVTSFEV